MQTQHRYDVVPFDRVTDDLTSLESKLAYCEYLGHVHLPMIEKCDQINHGYSETANPQRKENLEKVYARLHFENEFLRSSLAGTLFRAQYLSKRAQAQVQTVCSLIYSRRNDYLLMFYDRFTA